MENQIQEFAESFSNQLDKMKLEDNEQRNVNNPIVFLFIGDAVGTALSSIKRINEEKWQNSSGVLYFHVYETAIVSHDHQNIMATPLPLSLADRKNKRTSLYQAFYDDEAQLIELNSTFRKLSSTISEYGKVYSSLQKVNICVVTAIDDPANILIQEITLLLKSILSETFKTVDVDLYGLIKEKQDGENFAYSTSLGISFLKELELYQKDDYTFHKDLQITEDHLTLPVDHAPAPLFDLVYLLSDKNENGLISDEAMEQNYEIISNLNLLKNRKAITDYHEQMDSYDNANFRRAILGNSSEFSYATAGFSKVKRPNKAIALHAAMYFFQDILSWLKGNQSASKETILQLFELTDDALQKTLHELLPSIEKLEDMRELIGATANYSDIKNMTLKQAEDFLYGDGTERFFATNFNEPVTQRLESFKMTEKIEKCLHENIINNEKYGLYCAYLWTEDSTSHSDWSLMDELRKLIRETKNRISETETMLEQSYQQDVDAADFKKSFLPFTDKKNMQSFLNYFFKTIYGLKYQLIELNVKLDMLNQYLHVLSEAHQNLHLKVEQINAVEKTLQKAAATSLQGADQYLCKNIPEYYTGIISNITSDLKEKYGPNIYAEAHFLGNLFLLLENDPTAFLAKVLFICTKEILKRSEFNQNFEDELLERANVKVHYDNQDILSKEELFKQLFERLDANSANHIEVYNYSQEHRYEEKYFFGDFYSRFMSYAIAKESELGHYKVGCVHEKKSSGVEKLSLMGGFHLKDLMYYRKGEKYYQKYVESGFEFHVKPQEVSV